MKKSPCLNCTRVRDPRGCDDKNCKLWQAWFVGKWDDMRFAQRLAMEKVKLEQEGVCIGGEHYALPHRVNSYLGSDPCENCRCPKDLCALPCKVKRAWLKAREDVFL